MGNKSILEFIKDNISSVGWFLFIWGLPYDETEYFNRIEQEMIMRRGCKDD